MVVLGSSPPRRTTPPSSAPREQVFGATVLARHDPPAPPRVRPPRHVQRRGRSVRSSARVATGSRSSRSPCDCPPVARIGEVLLMERG
ncbi:hypothetical protein A7982_12742 [Minicystis rosea]|nr:hypothetical protein A7982_12742 [Minicystis rosea]